MPPEDPNFPEEIPPTPDRDDSTSASQPGETTDASTAEDSQWISAEEFSGEELDPVNFSGRSSAPSVSSEDGMIRIDEDLAEDAWTGAGSSREQYPASQARSRPSEGAATQQRSRSNQNRDPRRPSSGRQAMGGLTASRRSRGWLGSLQTLLTWVKPGWQKILEWVRLLLPRGWQSRFSDPVLTAILLGITILFLTILNPLGLGHRAKVAANPSPEEETAEVIADTASAEPETPDLAISPEQTLIGDIQDQVAQITRDYATGLVQSIQTDFYQGVLQVNLGVVWYELSPLQQDRAAQDIYQRVQELDFQGLRLVDPNDILVARSPVVGANMIILQRRSPLEPSAIRLD